MRTVAADPTYDPTEFQTVLTDWMERNGLSEMQAGFIIGISSGIINRWRKPRGDEYLVKPSVGSLEKLAPHLRIPLIQLKRMTRNLLPSDLAVLAGLEKGGRLDHRLEAFLNDVRAQWPLVDDQRREIAIDVSRTAWGLHGQGGGRSGRPRPRKPGPKKPPDLSYDPVLMIAHRI